MKHKNTIRFILLQVKDNILSIEDALKLLEEQFDSETIIPQPYIPPVHYKEPTTDPFKPHINPIIC